MARDEEYQNQSEFINKQAEKQMEVGLEPGRYKGVFSPENSLFVPVDGSKYSNEMKEIFPDKTEVEPFPVSNRKKNGVTYKNKTGNVTGRAYMEKTSINSKGTGKIKAALACVLALGVTMGAIKGVETIVTANSGPDTGKKNTERQYDEQASKVETQTEKSVNEAMQMLNETENKSKYVAENKYMENVEVTESYFNDYQETGYENFYNLAIDSLENYPTANLNSIKMELARSEDLGSGFGGLENLKPEEQMEIREDGRGNWHFFFNTGNSDMDSFYGRNIELGEEWGQTLQNHENVKKLADENGKFQHLKEDDVDKQLVMNTVMTSVNSTKSIVDKSVRAERIRGM